MATGWREADRRHHCSCTAWMTMGRCWSILQYSCLHCLRMCSTWMKTSTVMLQQDLLSWSQPSWLQNLGQAQMAALTAWHFPVSLWTKIQNLSHPVPLHVLHCCIVAVESKWNDGCCWGSLLAELLEHFIKLLCQKVHERWIELLLIFSSLLEVNIVRFA